MQLEWFEYSVFERSKGDTLFPPISTTTHHYKVIPDPKFLFTYVCSAKNLKVPR